MALQDLSPRRRLARHAAKAVERAANHVAMGRGHILGVGSSLPLSYSFLTPFRPTQGSKACVPELFPSMENGNERWMIAG